MGNQLFQQARQRVEQAEVLVNNASTPQQLALATVEIEKAKNNLSSAFANSTFAEQRQLGELQSKIAQLEEALPEYH